ncbi:MAG TPA: 30S ribosome-binding factor RbfA [Saprospiraceae bacterium]|nr:30S ribosome-binding factor RbfA [Saprospiraceae bacterium]MCB9327495.1 30S ribosome-binding factor RbfA [Lewinellaceae bacterium]HPK10317.1 30S ribosome-binding factor RbfA [Saprospiraceae bacterium]HPQ21310.1 30S ribosome-binding factor RbfA [Saprospiraceae bacterium]HRX29721.1 30S ribosome-binding factor RbfA [Saprospiraceae bacterium]
MESKRQLQVSSLIKRHFSTVLQMEGSYIYGNALVSVTNIYVTPDLSMAKIYLSIYNTENKQEVILMMEEHKHQLKQSLAARLRKHIRRMPDIDFYIDDTLDEMYKIDDMFGKLKDDGEM